MSDETQTVEPIEATQPEVVAARPVQAIVAQAGPAASQAPTALSIVQQFIDADVPDELKPVVHDAVALVLKAESSHAMTLSDFASVVQDVQPLIPDNWEALRTAIPAAGVSVMGTYAAFASTPPAVRVLAAVVMGLVALYHVRNVALANPPQKVVGAK